MIALFLSLSPHFPTPHLSRGTQQTQAGWTQELGALSSLQAPVPSLPQTSAYGQVPFASLGSVSSS